MARQEVQITPDQEQNPPFNFKGQDLRAIQEYFSGLGWTEHEDGLGGLDRDIVMTHGDMTHAVFTHAPENGKPHHDTLVFIRAYLLRTCPRDGTVTWFGQE